MRVTICSKQWESAPHPPSLGEPEIGVPKTWGGAGSDRFLLGDFHGNLYSVAGNNDYALITDFQKGQDSVQLDLENYSLGASPINGISGTAIYQGQELIGILEGVSQFNLVFEDGTFTTTLKAFGLGIG